MTQLERRKRRRLIASYVRNRGPTEGSVKDAVVEFEVGDGFVRACCGEFGVRLPDRRKGKPTTPKAVKIVAMLSTTTFSLSEVARKLKVSRQYVHKVYLQCLDRGLPVVVRSKGKHT